MIRPAGSQLTRRKFLRLGGTTLALASLPIVAAAANADQQAPSANFGGPTANADFYVTSYGSTPLVDVSNWTLKIHGLVNQPIVLTYDDIKRLPPVTQTLTLECIGNPPNGSAIGNAEWTGVMLKPLLERAGVNSSAVYAVMHGADGYSTGVPVDEIMRAENWMPYLMNGVPLPPVHGYPLRVFIPGKYGMKQPKWLTQIEFVDHEFIGYWEARGWSNEAWRKVNSGFFYPRAPGGILDILSLSNAAKVKAPINISGWALAGPSGINRVQISTDDGATWHDARLSDSKSPYIWTVWNYHFAPSKPGAYVVRAKATDGGGVTQGESDPQSGLGMSAQPRLRLEVTTVA
jgi:DMSO/TMAO reductase YedYZ molybdopterin-dependent catalytic subunit